MISCVHLCKLQKLVVANEFQLKHARMTTPECVCERVSISPWHAIVCVYIYEWVCNEQKIQVQRQKHTPECSRGILAHTGYQMSEERRNLLSGPVTHFFFLFLELKTGSGRPGINSLRTRLNPPSQMIRSKYVNPTSKITSL